MQRIAALVILVLILLSLSALPLAADATFTFTDVGQGDSIWVSDDTGFDLLIDGGSRGMGSRMLDAVTDREDLDVVVWTHGHEDHIGGLIEVLSGKPAQRIVYNGFGYDTITFGNLMDVVTSLMMPTTVGQRGDTYAWGELTAVAMHPGREYGSANNNSLVLRLSHGQVDVLLTGDAETEAEGAMLGSGLPLDAEVLKIGHHGSITSGSGAFLDAVGPEVGIISVGAGNPYGHPAPETLDRLATRGITTYRTDQIGTIVVRSNGITYTVNAPLPDAGAALYVPLLLRGYRMGPDPTPTSTPTPTSAAPTATATLARTPTRTSTPAWVQPTATPRICCKICTTGKACGDSCISRSYTCHKPPGCACDG